jgi:hypothetical protein
VPRAARAADHLAGGADQIGDRSLSREKTTEENTLLDPTTGLHVVGLPKHAGNTRESLRQGATATPFPMPASSPAATHLAAVLSSSATRAALFLALCRWVAQALPDGETARWIHEFDSSASAPVAYSPAAERGAHEKGADVCHHADAQTGDGRVIPHPAVSIS